MTPAARTKWGLTLFLVLAIVGGAIALLLHRPGTSTTSIRFVVPRGSSAHQIAQQLKQEGLIWHPWTFLFWVKTLDRHHAIHSGVYTLPSPSNGLELFQILRRGPPLFKVTFPEGWTSKQMAALLEAKGITSGDGFLALVQQNHLEGFLFPDTYLFEQGLSPDLVIERLVKRFHEKEPSDIHEQAKALKLSYEQVVTLASIVEREARAPQERPIIAGVFINRLNKHMRLESCATVEYALGAWKPKLTYNDLNVESPYNTYRHRGLPPGPIGNPGVPALYAASHPAKTDMMFFVADGQGTHRFSQNYSEHLAVQKQSKTK